MIENDLFADGQTQTRSMRLAMRSECFKQFIRNLRSDSGTGILNFGYDLFRIQFGPDENSATSRHGVGGVVDEIKKNAAEPLGVQHHFDRRNSAIQLNRYGFERYFSPQFLQKLLHELRKIAGCEHERRSRTLGEIQNLT